MRLVLVILLAFVACCAARPALKKETMDDAEFLRLKKMNRNVLNAKIRSLLTRRRQESKRDAIRTTQKKQSDQSQAQFGKKGSMELRAQQQYNNGREGLTQSQTQSQIELDNEARVEHQNQKQNAPGRGRQSQRQSQYNLGGSKGKIFESETRNQVSGGADQYQNQRQTFDTSMHDEQSESVSQDETAFQSQLQTFGSKLS